MSVAMPAGLPGQFAITDRAFDRLRALVHEQTGMALNDRQRAPVCARLGERLRHHGPTTFGQYSQHLKPAATRSWATRRRCWACGSGSSILGGTVYPKVDAAEHGGGWSG